MTKNGILCRINGRQIYLDPKNADSEGIHFVSHAHSDHLPSRCGGTILTSLATSEIASLRGFSMKKHTEKIDTLQLIDSGHVLGANGLLFDDIFYTGDICTRDRGFLKGARVPRCKTLITECTFGLQEFVFPRIEKVRDQVNRLISQLYDRGIPVILFGYSFGKAQMLTYLFGHWGPLYLHDSIREMNQLHRKFGIQLEEGISYSEAQKKGLLEKRPWMMIIPNMSAKNRLVSELKDKYGAVTISFSGWAQSKRFTFGRNADYSFPLSDHCDFNELVDLVIRSGAEQVYTVHGFVDEFAQYLQGKGINACPLQESALDNFT